MPSDKELERPDPDQNPEEFLAWVKSKAQFMKASRVNDDGEVYDLLCPKCGCDSIVTEEPDLGNPARCWECGHEFTITENCWKLDREWVNNTWAHNEE